LLVDCRYNDRLKRDTKFSNGGYQGQYLVLLVVGTTSTTVFQNSYHPLVEHNNIIVHGRILVLY